MEQLTGMDSAFVALENEHHPMHVLGVLILDPSGMAGGYSFEKFRQMLLDRIHLMPQLRRRLIEVPLGLDHAHWQEYPDFDVDDHLRHVQLDPPGDRRTLEAFVGELAGELLDRSKPLWEMDVVEGLDNGHVAVVTKMHHATIDGVSGADLMVHLFDLSPEVRDVEPPNDEWQPDDAPSRARLLSKAVVTQATNPLRMARQAGRSAGDLIRGARTTLAKRRESNVPLPAPKVRWSGALSTTRSVAFARTSLDDMKAIKAHHGGKINDVILAATTGALRSYLEWLGELPERALVASVPIAIKQDDEDRVANQMATMFAPLPVHLEDPVAQLREISASTQASKELTEAMGATQLMDWAELTAPRLLNVFSHAFARLRLGDVLPALHNVVVSNVPGPPLELWVAGAKVEAVYPMGPLLPGAGLNVTALSNMGNVDVGIIGDAESCPELWRVADAFPAAVQELLATIPGASTSA